MCGKYLQSLMAYPLKCVSFLYSVYFAGSALGSGQAAIKIVVLSTACRSFVVAGAVISTFNIQKV